MTHPEPITTDSRPACAAGDKPRTPPQKTRVDKYMHARLKNQRPCILWLTGLPGAGKSTLANTIEQMLYEQGYHTHLLDGDNLRRGLSRDLGFSVADRAENIRRAGETARLLVDAGLIVLAAFVSPSRRDRRMVRAMVEDNEFVEIFVDTPLETCEARDPKGFYRLARAGEIDDFTGVNAIYEVPEHAEIRVDTGSEPPQVSAGHVIAKLRETGIIEAR